MTGLYLIVLNVIYVLFYSVFGLRQLNSVTVRLDKSRQGDGPLRFCFYYLFIYVCFDICNPALSQKLLLV